MESLPARQSTAAARGLPGAGDSYALRSASDVVVSAGGRLTAPQNYLIAPVQPGIFKSGNYAAVLDQRPAGLRIAWSADFGYPKVDPEVAKLPGMFTTAAQWKAQAIVIDHKQRAELLGDWRKWFTENLIAK